MAKIRDRELDVYRGLSMIYIVGVIHTLYWISTIQTVLKSLFLFEMAVIFFVTGASYTLGTQKNYFEYLISRIIRVLIPYLGFGLFVIFLDYIARILGTSITQSNFIDFIKQCLNPFKLPPVTISFVTWHLWFIPIYLMFIPLIPIMYKVFQFLKNKLKYLPLVVVAILVFYIQDLEGLDTIKKIVFYSFWIYSGFFYKEYKTIEIKPIINVVISTLLVSIVIILALQKGYTIDMQKNKFPPNFIFLIYMMAMFSILYMFRKIILKLSDIKGLNKTIQIYAKHGFTLYLYQPFTYLLIYPIYLNVICLSESIIYKTIITIISMILIVLTNIVFANLFGKLESIRLPIKKSNTVECK